jgi:CheY-like chemotaxis protein
MNILWLDDDAPSTPFNIGRVSIQTAGSCKEAAEMLSGDALPDWVIVDLIVPQGGWEKGGSEFPGLDFIKFVSSQYHEQIQIAAFSIVMPPEMASQIHAVGAAKCYAKSSHSLTSIIEDLRRDEAERKLKPGHDLNPAQTTAYGDLLQNELKKIIEELLDRLSLSTRAITAREIAELHKAKLALENDEEKRLRSYQTLEALKDYAETDSDHPAKFQPEELRQLRNTVELIINHKRAHQIFDVFLSYNSADAEEVEMVATALKANAILPWFDKWEIKPGARWPKELGEQIENIRCAAVFIGGSGVGPWHEQEIEALLVEFVRRKCPVIPVLLSSAGLTPSLPVFLRGATRVDFRKPNPDNIQRLLWAIIG